MSSLSHNNLQSFSGIQEKPQYVPHQEWYGYASPNVARGTTSFVCRLQYVVKKNKYYIVKCSNVLYIRLDRQAYTRSSAPKRTTMTTFQRRITHKQGISQLWVGWVEAGVGL